MRVSVSQAKGRLTDLVRRAEAGDEVILTRHGHPAVRLVPVVTPPGGLARRAILEGFQKLAAQQVTPGASAERSQDFLYDESGLPR